ncbi:hypothetical protein FRACYDRAFT_235162 [Fragilariopsis cylindrus CCMP1102]|uniref:Uncharacterized protein n=1 Tax=Fragilariopsis cylindrus CCMP1102 TaxID=635003 RepID=A0A1E7FTV8_9STRA|nr:hypothetical protein FRACYDRAFT_235162 [Fragilariopsis cylindrus CCMP1102]|eukprot:OEU21537.1 hypothetical protein FRACYDRAFT_235162 [Fragilariopsis cylindrus CCMP1102]
MNFNNLPSLPPFTSNGVRFWLEKRLPITRDDDMELGYSIEVNEHKNETYALVEIRNPRGSINDVISQIQQFKEVEDVILMRSFLKYSIIKLTFINIPARASFHQTKKPSFDVVPKIGDYYYDKYE